MMHILLLIFFGIFGYLSGSLCSAIIISKIFNLPDPREGGSKNPGATNVLRLSGKRNAAIVLLADILKGFIPVIIAQLVDAGVDVVSLTGFAAVMGHMFPIFFKFKGGKGVATAMGTFLGMNLIFGTIIIATWLLVAKLSHYVSLASIAAIMLAPFYAIALTNYTSVFMPLLVISVCVLYKHRGNITRLIDGVEPKIDLGPRPAKPDH